MADRKDAKRRRDDHVASLWAIENNVSKDSVLFIIDLRDADLLVELMEFAQDDDEYEEIFQESEVERVNEMMRYINKKIKHKKHKDAKSAR